MSTEKKNLLEVRNLTVHYETDEGIVEAVNNVSFILHPVRYWA